MNRLSLRNNRLKFKTVGKLPFILEELIEHTPNIEFIELYEFIGFIKEN